MTETQDRFAEGMKKFDKLISSSKVTFNDAMRMFELCDTLYQQKIRERKARDKWKNKYFELKKKYEG